MNLKTWKNGEKASVVQKTIEDNFKTVAKYLNRNMLSLTTEERLLLSDDYLSDGLIVYDTDKNSYFKYNSKNASWEIQPTSKSYCFEFDKTQWVDNIILLPYELHKVDNPMVYMFMMYNNSYETVLGGVEIDALFNITLTTDLPFDGKVVIK